MAILLTDRERHELLPGRNSLGGDARDAVRLTPLANLPLVGTITMREEAPPMVHRLSSRITLMVDGVMLGAAPTVLTEGATLQVGATRMTYYGSEEAAAAAAPDVPRRRRESELATQVMRAVAAPARAAALIALATGRIVRVAGGQLVIGRSEEADVVLTGKGVSRRHAVLRVEDGAHLLEDGSTNGTYVNGERLAGPRALQPGDTIVFGDEHYRFDLVDPALAERMSRGAGAEAPLAELEVVRGRGERSSYRIDRPVCAIGRGPHSDVSLHDESVAATHATLLMKGDTWYLTDLRSPGGTYVDGYRVAGERALAAGATIRVGEVSLAFWPKGTRRAEQGPRAAAGVLRRFARALFPGS